MKFLASAAIFLLALVAGSNGMVLEDRQVHCDLACVKPYHFCDPCGCFLTPCPTPST
ncbi:hypothetical protein JAAARDRAFT_33576 [Jaapia argillacea MUCL 33604]|uniref:Uncharacterized protein n=1 Tax=Jaapia argillacea MUCL 33604 TaxID=933084 RepID=A0A067PY87_9AGAM|nr:hypothetical protein JAAARDRAFT_33576 [Jaapia argillacea MUCL 33604]